MENTLLIWILLGAAFFWVTTRNAAQLVARSLTYAGNNLQAEIVFLRRRIEHAEDAQAKFRVAALECLQNIEVSSNNADFRLDDLIRQGHEKNHSAE